MKFENRPEAKSVSYEKALEGARFLYAAGVENPFAEDLFTSLPEDSAVQEAWNTLQKWAHQNQLDIAGGYTVEKASNIVLREMMLIEAGYTSPDILRALRDDLRVELAGAIKEGSENGATPRYEQNSNMQKMISLMGNL